jgi:hypothetical protein
MEGDEDEDVVVETEEQKEVVLCLTGAGVQISTVAALTKVSLRLEATPDVRDARLRPFLGSCTGCTSTCCTEIGGTFDGGREWGRSEKIAHGNWSSPVAANASNREFSSGPQGLSRAGVVWEAAVL